MSSQTIIETSTPSVTPGWKTSELWLAVGIHVINALVAANIFTSEKWAKIAAIASSTLVQIGYQLSRAKLKSDPAFLTSTSTTTASPGATAAPAIPGSGNIPAAMIALLMLPLVFLCAGCQGTPLSHVMLAETAYTTTLDALSDLRAAGKISDTQYNEIEIARQAIAQGLDEAEAAAIASKPLDVTTAMDAVNRALDTLIQIELTAEKSSAVVPKQSTAPPLANTPARIGGQP